jgi:hypothetical protein
MSEPITLTDTIADIPEQLESLVVLLRGQRVMLSPHLAALYGVEPRSLVQAVKRNKERFPADFMFQLTDAETQSLRAQFIAPEEGTAEEASAFKSQFVISSEVGTRATPYAFTEQGVAMLSSVLRSPRAVSVNIEIMRAFVRLRQLLAGNAELTQRLNELEASVKAGTEKSDQQFRVVFDALRQLMTPPAPKQGRIGFRQEEK